MQFTFQVSDINANENLHTWFYFLKFHYNDCKARKTGDSVRERMRNLLFIAIQSRKHEAMHHSKCSSYMCCLLFFCLFGVRSRSVKDAQGESNKYKKSSCCTQIVAHRY